MTSKYEASELALTKRAMVPDLTEPLAIVSAN